MFNDEKELDEKYIHFLNITLWWTPNKKENKQKTSQQNCESKGLRINKN